MIFVKRGREKVGPVQGCTPGGHEAVPGFGACRLAALAGVTGLYLVGCWSPEHPDFSRYEYRYVNGSFVPPYDSFPDGRERGDWQCYDPKFERAFDCTFVHSGWDHYQFIFRKRR
jgi:hypothetical protein